MRSEETPRSKTIFNVDGWAAGVVVEVRVRVYRGVDVLCVGERSREGCIRLSWRCARAQSLERSWRALCGALSGLLQTEAICVWQFGLLLLGVRVGKVRARPDIQIELALCGK